MANRLASMRVTGTVDWPELLHRLEAMSETQGPDAAIIAIMTPIIAIIIAITVAIMVAIMAPIIAISIAITVAIIVVWQLWTSRAAKKHRCTPPSTDEGCRSMGARTRLPQPHSTLRRSTDMATRALQIQRLVVRMEAVFNNIQNNVEDVVSSKRTALGIMKSTRMRSASPRRPTPTASASSRG
jgi:hypothetical protein